MWVTQLNDKVKAEFPSPGENMCTKRIDLTAKLIAHPAATYLTKARGTSMVEAGIFDGNVSIVNQAIKPKHDVGCCRRRIFDRHGLG